MKKIKKIGKGAFSQVWLAENNQGERIVLKQFQQNGLDQARREYMFLKAVHSPQVVKALGFDEVEGLLYLEHIAGKKREQFSNNKELAIWMTHLAAVISRIHTYGVCYNDLKPDNIIERQGKPVLIDFGLATPARFQDRKFRGTLAYAAPEKIFFQTNSPAADVFSWGLLYFYYATGILPAEELGLSEYKNLLKNETEWQVYLQRNFKNEFILNCLSLEPQKRPSMAEISHKLAQKYNLELNYIAQNVVDQYIFEPQQAAVSRLDKTGSLTFSEADEIERIAERAGLWAESQGKQTLVLKESEYIWQPELFWSKVADDKVKEEEIYELLQTSGTQVILIRDQLQHHTEFFNNLSKSANFWILQKSTVSELGEVGKTEMQKLVLQHQLKLDIKDYRPTKPYLARIWLQSKLGGQESVSHKTKAMLTILSQIDVPLSLNVLQELISEDELLLHQFIAQPEISFKADSVVYSGKQLSTKPDLQLAQKLYSLALRYKQNQLALQLAFVLGNREDALKLLQESIDTYIKQEFYTSAYETLRLMQAKLGKLPLQLQKKEAFLLRKQGKLEAALDSYEAIKLDKKDMEYAVLESDKAVILQELERLTEAAQIYRNLLSIFKDNKKVKAFLRTMNNLGVVEVQAKNFAAAQKTFLQLLEQAQKFGDKQFITMAHLNLADVFLRQAEWKRSLLQAQTAAELGTKFKKKDIETWAQIYGMQAQWGLGKFDLLPKIIETMLEDEELQENSQLYHGLLVASLNIAAALDSKLGNKIFKQIEEKQLPLTSEDSLELFWYCVRSKNYYRATKLMPHLPAKEVKELAAALLSAQQDEIMQKLQQLALQNDIFLLLNSAFQLMKSGLIDKDRFWPEIKKYDQLHAFVPFQLLKQEQPAPPKQAGINLLWDIISKIHSNDNFQNTMQAVLAGIIKIGQLQRAVFFAFDDAKMLPVVGLNSNLEFVDLESLAISTTILQETLKLGETRYFYDLQEDIPFDIHSSIFGLGLRTAVCYPLLVNNKVEGVIYADTTNDRRFNEAEQNLLQTVFAQAKVALEKTKKIEKLENQQQETEVSHIAFPEIIGNSKEMQQIYDVMKTVGEHNVNVLITGPTGSGKELIAKALHSEYDVKSAFVPVNCAAIPETLLESELFGYAKGAFTGADKNRKGKIEAANGGTLFLDEIGELPAVLQAKLLRVLQERVITPLGSNKEIPVSIRLICASNQDLEKMVEEGSFRQDLFYRINVVSINLPPLKDRPDDILPLAEYFLEKYNEKFNKNLKSISNSSARILLNHKWPGNVRQLENLIEKAVLMSPGDYLEVQDLLEPDNLEGFSADETIPTDWQNYKEYRKRFVNQLDRRFTQKIITENNGNINQASRQAHIPRPQIYRILNKKDT